MLHMVNIYIYIYTYIYIYICLSVFWLKADFAFLAWGTFVVAFGRVRLVGWGATIAEHYKFKSARIY